MTMLNKLYYDLQAYEPETRQIETATLPDKKKNILSKLTNVFKASTNTSDFVDRPKSLYIYGGAGCGKVIANYTHRYLSTCVCNRRVC